MGILFYVGWCAFGLGMGYLIAQSTKPKCNHRWKLIESGKVRNNGKHIGWIKVYECVHCLKMRKEQVELD